VEAAYDEAPLKNCDISVPARDLIKAMLQQDWRNRITIEGLENHRFFEGYRRDE
jgi:hypothetical protein